MAAVWCCPYDYCNNRILGLAPGYEGKITTRLMQDVTTSLENKTSIQVHFDQVLRYMTILFGFI